MMDVKTKEYMKKPERFASMFNGTFDIIAKNCPKKLVKSKLHGQFLCAHNNYFSAS